MNALAEMISSQSSLTESDWYVVCVTLERLGNFQEGLSSEAKAIPKEVTTAAIIKARILFCLGKHLPNLSFRKAG